MTTPTVHFVIGSTGAGKTTYARTLAAERRALVFSIDTWMHNLFAADLAGAPDMAAIVSRTQRARIQMWEVATQTLALGVEPVFDSGLLTAADRASELSKAKALGFQARTHFVDTPADERWRRVSARNAARDGGYAFEVTRPMFDFIERVWQRPDAAEIAANDILVIAPADPR